MLLIPEDQVDPLMQMIGDVITFQRLPHNLQKQGWISFGPFGELHITDPLAILPDPQVQAELVDQKPWIVLEELRDKFFEAGRVLHDVVPVAFDAFEESVGFIELAALQFQHVLGLLPDEVADYVAGSRVVAAVHESGRWHLLVAH